MRGGDDLHEVHRQRWHAPFWFWSSMLALVLLGLRWLLESPDSW